jgi:hypothetical protein
MTTNNINGTADNTTCRRCELECEGCVVYEMRWEERIREERRRKEEEAKIPLPYYGDEFE